uniref:Uncharacterized protein n=1 Tax=Chromera velia CCMP2878 TaxID=1169474 RepID=A0A0G4G2P8_9ALVE|eukprot:Cvel_19974.t1-p1 / transcript=Cvel_19974.t1 / gene=Cvel_19974 / organism=Chromera_velia_CCMP2878 / gene_product=Plectin, putative / transcript_product=Plectin, putative / location=Cvel_scaffold1759:9768-13681(-) / protein_length=867 / sequence_SO=supercontig / SO=protein_coding / is_pseudo=false
MILDFRASASQGERLNEEIPVNATEGTQGEEREPILTSVTVAHNRDRPDASTTSPPLTWWYERTDTLELQLRNLREVTRQLRTQAKADRETISELSDALRKEEKISAELAESLQDRDGEVVRLEEALKGLQTEKRNLVRAAARLREQRDQEKRATRERVREMERAEDEKEKVERESAGYKKSLKGLGSLQNFLSEELERERKKRTDLKAQVRAKLERFETEQSAVRAELSRHDAVVEGWERRVREGETKVASLEGDLAHAAEVNEHLDRLLEEKQAERDEVHRQLREVHAHNSQLHEELEEAKKRLFALESRRRMETRRLCDSHLQGVDNLIAAQRAQLLNSQEREKERTQRDSAPLPLFPFYPEDREGDTDRPPRRLQYRPFPLSSGDRPLPLTSPAPPLLDRKITQASAASSRTRPFPLASSLPLPSDVPPRPSSAPPLSRLSPARERPEGRNAAPVFHSPSRPAQAEEDKGVMKIGVGEEKPVEAEEEEEGEESAAKRRRTAQTATDTVPPPPNLSPSGALEEAVSSVSVPHPPLDQAKLHAPKNIFREVHAPAPTSKPSSDRRIKDREGRDKKTRAEAGRGSKTRDTPRHPAIRVTPPPSRPLRQAKELKPTSSLSRPLPLPPSLSSHTRAVSPSLRGKAKAAMGGDLKKGERERRVPEARKPDVPRQRQAQQQTRVQKVSRGTARSPIRTTARKQRETGGKERSKWARAGIGTRFGPPNSKPSSPPRFPVRSVSVPADRQRVDTSQTSRSVPPRLRGGPRPVSDFRKRKGLTSSADWDPVSLQQEKGDGETGREEGASTEPVQHQSAYTLDPSAFRESVRAEPGPSMPAGVELESQSVWVPQPVPARSLDGPPGGGFWVRPD